MPVDLISWYPIFQGSHSDLTNVIWYHYSSTSIAHQMACPLKLFYLFTSIFYSINFYLFSIKRFSHNMVDQLCKFVDLIVYTMFTHYSQWRHNELDGISKHRRLDCLLNCLFRHRSKKTWKVCVKCKRKIVADGEINKRSFRNIHILLHGLSVHVMSSLFLWGNYHMILCFNYVQMLFSFNLEY